MAVKQALREPLGRDAAARASAEATLEPWETFAVVRMEHRPAAAWASEATLMAFLEMAARVWRAVALEES
jgi:hypothetical protein